MRAGTRTGRSVWATSNARTATSLSCECRATLDGGVRKGDFLASVGSDSIGKSELEVMEMIMSAKRPITITFRRALGPPSPRVNAGALDAIDAEAIVEQELLKQAHADEAMALQEEDAEAAARLTSSRQVRTARAGCGRRQKAAHTGRRRWTAGGGEGSEW